MSATFTPHPCRLFGAGPEGSALVTAVLPDGSMCFMENGFKLHPEEPRCLHNVPGMCARCAADLPNLMLAVRRWHEIGEALINRPWPVVPTLPKGGR